MIQSRAVRRSSLIAPWGVGAMVPFPSGETLMIASLDYWFPNNLLNQQEIIDERLKKRLGVSKLICPPEYIDALPKKQTIPAVRFPRWHYCHFCGRMHQIETVYEQRPKCDAYKWKIGRKCERPGNLLIPERFVVICSNGHIDDFPIAEWIHSYGNYKYNPEKCVIRRSTGGSSSSLAGVFYECTCGAKRSMSEAFNKNALSKIGYKCRCCMPWQGKIDNSEEECKDGELRVALRGASNVWFANICSSIYIPISKENLSIAEQTAEMYLKFCGEATYNGKLNEVLIDQLAAIKKIDVNLLKKRIIELQTGNSSSSEEEKITEDQYRFAEYNVLKKDNNYPEESFCSHNKKISCYSEIIHKYFNSISLVSQLKETRVFTGFSRVIPKELSFKERDKLLFIDNKKRSWLPAIQNQGEGIFFEFNSDSINLWIKNNTWAEERIHKLSENYKKSIFGKNSEGKLNIEFVLIHTFAHLIINQLCLECGYGSSSLRERIYCEKTSNNLGMYGVLIYTSAGDSEGSLGGVVRQGKEGSIENVIVNAINNAAWCSSDPVCIQSFGQGPESCNLAACHNCALLPETSCENGNRLLDRGFLVGDLENRDKGFFSDLLSSNK